MNCEYPNCTEKPLLLGYGKWLCGNHFMEIRNKQLNIIWEEIENGNDKNTRD
jgi:hypothetical protein